jgi:hypothetical protein
MMSSYMTKLEFPPEPYLLFRLGKLSYICCLLLHWVLSSFVDPYERFVMLLKSRSHTHHPHILAAPTLGVGAKTCLPSRSTQKCSIPTWRWTQKNVRFSIHQINAPSSCCYLSKVLLQKRGMGLCKSCHIKKERKKIKKESWKNGQVSEISKTMGT